MTWEVLFDPAFAAEAAAFERAVQLEIAALVGLLRQFGPQLRRPHCNTLNGSKHANMIELRFTLADGELPSLSIPNGKAFYLSAAASRGSARSSSIAP